MRELDSRAYCYLGRYPVLCMDMIEALRRGNGQVCGVREDGTLLYERRSRAYFLAAEDVEAGEALCLGLKKPRQLVVHDLKNAQMLQDRFGYEEIMECRAAAWLEVDPPKAWGKREVLPLEEGQAREVLERFPQEFQEDEARERAAAGELWGTYEGKRLVGVAGLYPEGGVGMLAVDPEHWRQGIGQALLSHVTGWCLEKYYAPFAHIPVGAEGALGLYEKVGYTIAEKSLYWLGDE